MNSVATRKCHKKNNKGPKKQNKEWFDKECEIIINQKNEARLKWLATGEQTDYEAYKQKRKETGVYIKRKKAKWIDTIMDQLENDNQNNVKLYRHIKTQSRKSTTINIDDQEWEKYFSTLLRRTDEEMINHPKRRNTANALDETKIPTEEEFNKILSRLKRNKAAGLDTIVNEMIEYGAGALQSPKGRRQNTTLPGLRFKFKVRKISQPGPPTIVREAPESRRPRKVRL
ncbi:hypothetical protein QE152_g33668 [Popillia japonica]|uniref:Endonuclease-reverse transcriptase n=1 Tax=Popillia japonica TaxID=7064 RepID=A0AAW1IW47_POPJA